MWLISSESMKFSDIFATGVLGLLVMSFGCDEAAAAVHSITDYGAVSDTTQLSTEAVQRAIDACSAAGGGTVTVPSGSYKIGSIFLKSNVTLNLENGSTLYGSTDISDYTPVTTDYVSLRTHTPTIQLDRKSVV